MFLFIILLMFEDISCLSSNYVGSALFYRKLRDQCWSEDDIGKLRARKVFEQVVPEPVTPDKINGKYIEDIIKYFRKALQIVESEQDRRVSLLLKEALADSWGAHMRSEILPTTRFAYYAGYVPYRKVKQLHDMYDDIKNILNTQGLGWKPPEKVPEWTNLTVDKFFIGSGKIFDPCACLVIKRDSSLCIHLPAPILVDENEPSAVALPFKTSGMVSLSSPNSKNILLKYYTTASRCILRMSPAKCRHADFVNFNNDLWHWMKRDVAPHLVDEKLYAAYGGVLRIAAAVQSYGKGLSRRNLIEYQDSSPTKWHPWKALRDTYMSENIDWTPYIYVGLVLLAVFLVTLVQIFYSYCAAQGDCCRCKRSKPSNAKEKDVAYADVESNIPALLPKHHSAVYYSDRIRVKKSPFKSKTSSLGTLKSQKVYDLHENTEKLMDVIVSDNESSESKGVIVSDESSESEEADNEKTVRSPPEIDTPITEMRIDKRMKRQCQLYSSTVTYCHGASESWSGSSTSSEQSVSSASSRSRCGRARSRDLAWARRVVSKHSVHRSTSGTLDVTSFTTPPSRR